jgi:hypothetical protein
VPEPARCCIPRRLRQPARSRCPGRDGVADIDQPAPPPSRLHPPATSQAAQILLHPLCGRAAQRTLTGRLHPLAASRPNPRRDHQLDRRPLPLRTMRQRPPPHHRRHRPCDISESQWRPRHPGLCPDRQRHGLTTDRLAAKADATNSKTNCAASASPRSTQPNHPTNCGKVGVFTDQVESGIHEARLPEAAHSALNLSGGISGL